MARAYQEENVWECPKCGHKETQPKSCTAVWHHCRKADGGLMPSFKKVGVKVAR